MNEKFRFFREGEMSLPMSLKDLAYEHFPPQFQDEHGDIHDDCEVMRYLFVKDKHGAELCEGDFVKIDDFPDNYMVMDVTNAACHAFGNIKNYSVMEVIGERPFEIIGNRCEHPELGPVIHEAPKPH